MTEENPNYEILNDKHLLFAESMRAAAPEKIQKNLTALDITNVTRQTTICLVMMPCWGIYFPPYNLARLSSVIRHAGYKTTVIDLNVESYHYLKKKGCNDYWHPTRYYNWYEDYYFKDIHPNLEPLLNDYIEKIITLNADIVGFSLYWTNCPVTYWIVKQLKDRGIKSKLIAGGPLTMESWYDAPEMFDYWVKGEAEQTVLDFLEKIEHQDADIPRKLISTTPRLDIDSLPFPDYTDYDFGLYKTPHGVSAEISRGCVAKCSFCTETHFWKYRYRKSKDIVDEIEYQMKVYGSTYFWFIDSLVNGNLKELQQMAEKIIDKKLKIKWQGYARCDGRMDQLYFRTLKESGCELLNFGIESGAQKVLDLMQKKIMVDEVEQNLRDITAVGIKSHTNWIVGFPNEDHDAFAQTLIMLWRNKDNIDSISPGMTCGDSTMTDFEFRRDRYNMSDRDKPYLDDWYTQDMLNTRVNRMIRLKLMHVFFDQCEKYGRIKNGAARPNIKHSYDFKSLSLLANDIEYETFNYNIIKEDINPLANGVVNEIWVLLRQLWRVFGEFEIRLAFDPKTDLDEFGASLSSNYTATHKFKIDSTGKWEADHNYKFIQAYTIPPWNEIDYSFELKWVGQGQW